jgi:UDP-2,3-diacylglucosamine hydrolase
MRVFAISDVHLENESDPMIARLEAWWGSMGLGDTFVAAGDLFDVFVGPKAVFARRFDRVIQALHEFGSRGGETHFIEGNHDFFHDRVFRGIPGFQFHSGRLELERAGKRFCFEHGDLVDRKDYGYRLLRTFFRSLPMRAFIYGAPGQWVDWLGRSSSHASQQLGPRLPDQLPPQQRSKLRELYRQYAAMRVGEGFDYVILGHCHEPDDYLIRTERREGRYLNVGFPKAHGDALMWSAQSGEMIKTKIP